MSSAEYDDVICQDLAVSVSMSSGGSADIDFFLDGIMSLPCFLTKGPGADADLDLAGMHQPPPAVIRGTVACTR